MKKFLVATLIAILVIALVGCSSGQTFEAKAQTLTKLNGVNAREYGDDNYFHNSYFIVVSFTTEKVEEIELKTNSDNGSSTYNFVLIRHNAKEVLNILRPIDEMFIVEKFGDTYEYTIVYYSNYAVDENDFIFSVSYNNEYKLFNL